jgi:hypothetical protein
MQYCLKAISSLFRMLDCALAHKLRIHEVSDLQFVCTYNMSMILSRMPGLPQLLCCPAKRFLEQYD